MSLVSEDNFNNNNNNNNNNDRYTMYVFIFVYLACMYVSSDGYMYVMYVCNIYNVMLFKCQEKIIWIRLKISTNMVSILLKITIVII